MSRWSGGKEHDRFGVEEGYETLSAGCEGSEKNGTNVVLCKVRLVGA